MIERALRNRYPMTEAQRLEIVEGALKDSREAGTVKDRATARRVFILADSLNARRERVESEERIASVELGLGLVRDMLHASQARDTLSSVAAQALPSPDTPPSPLPQTAEVEHVQAEPAPAAEPSPPSLVRRGPGPGA